MSPARPRQQQREEEQAFNKNIVCVAFTQSDALCAAHYREQEDLILTQGLRVRDRAVGQSGMTEGLGVGQRYEEGRLDFRSNTDRCTDCTFLLDRWKSPQILQ